MKRLAMRAVPSALALGIFALAYSPPARAEGTAVIVQSDGSSKSYSNVHIAIRDASMAITSSDGQGMLVLGKAACTKIGELVRCLPYDATLLQNGTSLHIPLQSGTVWLNPTDAPEQLSHSSAKLQARGVLLAVKTKRGTYVTLTGVVDEVQR